MKAIVEILNKLNEVFADFDKKVLEDSINWAFNRRNKLSEYMNSPEYKDKSVPYSVRYNKAVDIAGGKVWYNAMYGSNLEMLENFVIKNCEAISKRRNASIAKKLEKAGVKEVISEEFIISANGFEGYFGINCDSGVKKVHISSILAGGYNVQCLHNRVLVKIK